MSKPTSKYPSSRPFQAPNSEPVDSPAAIEPALSRREPSYVSDARLRALTFRRAIGIVGSVVLVAGLAAIGVMVASKSTGPPAVASKTGGNKAPGKGAATAVAIARSTPSTRSRVPEEEEPKTADQAKLPAPDPMPVDPEKANLALQTLGSLTVAHLYQTYLSIGLLADGAENGVYADADAKKMLGIITALMDTVDDQLLKLARGGLEPDDRKHLERFRGLATLLRTQATELRAYWDTSNKEVKKGHEAKFHQARKEAWAGIKEMLGIQEE